MVKFIIIFVPIIISIIVCGKVLLISMEYKMTFHPDREIESLPDEFGLKYEDVYFENKDAVTLHGWFFPTKDAKVTLILFHGNAENVGDRLDYIRMLHDLSINIFVFDYQGYGRSKGSPSESGTYDDALAAYNYLKARKDIDPRFISFFGRSLGGAIAIDLATRVNCHRLIIEGAFSSIKDMAKDIFPFIPLYLVVSNKYDNVSKVAKINMPKLIIHGTLDETVPFSQGKKLFDVAKEPKEFYEIYGAGHNDTYIVDGKPYFERIKEFLGI